MVEETGKEEEEEEEKERKKEKEKEKEKEKKEEKKVYRKRNEAVCDLLRVPSNCIWSSYQDLSHTHYR